MIPSYNSLVSGLGNRESCHNALSYDFCQYQVIYGVNYGKHQKQCLPLNKHHSLMRIWLCKLEDLNYCLFAPYITDEDLEMVSLNSDTMQGRDSA